VINSFLKKNIFIVQSDYIRSKFIKSFDFNSEQVISSWPGFIIPTAEPLSVSNQDKAIDYNGLLPIAYAAQHKNVSLLNELSSFLESGNILITTLLGSSSFNEIVEGESGDLSFLEQSAAMIGSMDNMDKMFCGETYVPILFFWMPRVYWDDKPKLNQWQHDIATPGRNYGQMGQISLLSGESYANFGYFGAFAIPWFVGMLYSKIYFYYRNINSNHKGFLLLLLMHMILFQVWRDGLISLIIFPIVNYLPLILLILSKRNSKA
jgi:hypothetical protein